MTREKVFALVKADMDRATAEMRQHLERELFRVDPLLVAIPPPKPKPWWGRWRYAVRCYLSTLWLALCGEDLHRAADCDGDY